ncbi:uncharacterized protein LOC143912248 [Arctopsyche grandis]|uniref:uncharacterized protein LOC143912248 n=1 Tax=Arctopsyche grandis TaxID=121162 RepID=UPI00406D884B
MKTSTHVLVRLVLLFVWFNQTQCKIVCPRQCHCDLFEELQRAACTNHNIIDINIGVYKYVQIYNLSHNAISKLEDFSFENMNYKLIERLDLSHNGIFWIGLHAFAGLDKLESFDLSYNRIQSIPNDIFSYNKNLTILNLSKNKFTRLSNQPFLSHDSLKVIDLSYCLISFLPKNVFQELPKLTELDLRGNYMIGLKINIFESMKNLRFLNLNNNSWHCNNEFVRLEEWLLVNKVKYQLQCKLNVKKFEEIKMLSSSDTIEDEEQNLDELWIIEDKSEKRDDEIEKAEIDDTFLMLYNDRVPSLISLFIGFQVGIVMGILGTYCWMAKLYKCKKIVLPNRRHIRRLQRMHQNEINDNLLWNFIQEERFATPPSTRRHLSSFCRDLITQTTNSESINLIARDRIRTQAANSQSTNLVQENRIQTDPSIQNIRRQNSEQQNRPETPPPTYNDCLSDVVIPS